jgi:iron-sulfur cluster repair protein YtfE (RIC family)
MDELFDLIDQIIKEHEQIVPEVQNLERMTDDPEAILALERAKEDFLVVRTNAQEQGIQNLEELLGAIDQRLQAHFDREERGLLTAFERRGDKMFAAALRVLLLEHEELKNQGKRLPN